MTEPKEEPENIYITVLDTPIKRPPLPSTPLPPLRPPYPVNDEGPDNKKKYSLRWIVTLSSITGILFISCIVFMALYIKENGEYSNEFLNKTTGKTFNIFLLRNIGYR